MYYSLIGLLALIILIITGYDILIIKKSHAPSDAVKAYRLFLFVKIFYYLTDIFWGVFEYYKMRTALFYDTELYFIAMAAGILFLTNYVTVYLDDKSAFSAILLYSGRVFFAAVTALTVANLFRPVMFRVDEACVYHTAPARYAVLFVQIIILLLTSAYAFAFAAKAKGVAAGRYLSIGFFALMMTAAIAVQLFLPYLPLYAIGYMLGGAVLRKFVVDNEKKEYRLNLEAALARDRKHLEELHEARKLAYTDALTGAKTRLAYHERVEALSRKIEKGEPVNYAVALFDINDLKGVNDHYGHEAGDKCIAESFSLISGIFKNCDVYRVGGDEFIAVLEGADLEKRDALVSEYERAVSENAKRGGATAALGLAVFDLEKDHSFERTVERADQLMYKNKEEFKRVNA